MYIELDIAITATAYKFRTQRGVIARDELGAVFTTRF